jgi:hypothetical protein
MRRRRRVWIDRHRNHKSMNIATPISRPTAVAEGVLVVNKEAGWTSHDVVAKMRAIFGGVKVGHACRCWWVAPRGFLNT